MDAHFILDSLKRHWPKAAIVPELTIRDELHLAYGDSVAHHAWTRRIDALMIQSLERTAIEIKVTRADFSREHHQKWAPWVRVCHRFIYAVPAGLIEPREVWEIGGEYSAGLVYVHEDGRVETVRKCRPNKHPEHLPQHVIQNLAYRAAGRSAIEGDS